MSNSCPHGSILPRGLKCDRGYLCIRVMTEQGPYFSGCGPHTPAMENVARLALENLRVKQKLGTFKLPSKAQRVKVKDAYRVFFQHHYTDWRDPVTNECRAETAKRVCESMAKHLLDYFGEFYLDAVTVKSINQYKKLRVETEDAAHGTFNKEKGLLSSLINNMMKWVKGEEINPVILPPENPCEFVDDLVEVPRDRIASTQEITRLHQACIKLGDLEFYTIILFALDTCLRLGDLKKAAGHTGTIHIRQGKTKGMVMLPESPFAKSLTQESFKDFESRWGKIRAESGLLDLQFRDFRRTGATLAKMGGATTELIKDTLGHADAKTTAWYLNVKDVTALEPLVKAKRKILEGL